MEESTVLAEHSKLNLIILEQQSEASGASEVVSGTPQVLQVQQAVLLPVEQGPRDLDAYRLPRMAINIDDELKAVTRGNCPESLKRKIVEHIYYDFCKYTIYPQRLYSNAAEQLVHRYPQLRDESDNGFVSWKGHLRVKAKNSRRSMSDSVAGVGEAREKNKKAKDSKACAGLATPAVKHVARSVHGVTVWGAAEDEDSEANHLSLMAKEVGKTTPDWGKISTSMECTFDERRHWMLVSKPLVGEVLAKYPALGYAGEIEREFQRITKVGAAEGLKAFIKKFGRKVVTLAAETRHTKAAAAALYKCIDLAPAMERDDILATGVVELLPQL